MITLLLDNKKAIIKNGSSIKLTRENPFFTDSGDYTLDVVLPLQGCIENQRIFGVLHYGSMSHKKLASKVFSFKLYTEILSLEGRAVVTNVTHEEVKVQLLSGNSALNFDSLGEKGEKYIDELDLGRVYGEEWDASHPDEEQTAMGTIKWLYSAAFTANQREEKLHGTLSKTDCVFFPVYSQADGAFANLHEYSYWGEAVWVEADKKRYWRDDGESYMFPFDEWSQHLPNSTKDLVQITLDEANIVFAPQPYLAVIVERVLKELGYTLNPKANALRSGWFAQIFIANAREAIHYADCLPHWTVKEFFDELRNTYGMIVLVSGTQATIVSRSTLYTSRQPIEIKNAIDERNTDIDTESEQKDTTSGNVGYDFTESTDQWLCIGEDAYESMKVLKVRDADLVKTFNNLTEEEREQSNVLLYATDSNSRYGIFKKLDGVNFIFPEVDQIGPLFRDDDFKVDTRLKIVPCFMAEDIPVNRVKRDWGTAILEYSQSSVYPVDPTKPELDGAEYGGFHVPFLITADTRMASTRSPYNLYKAIMEGVDTTEEENAKQEVMEVACNCGLRYSQTFFPNVNYQPELTKAVSIPYPVGVPFMRSRFTDREPNLAINHVANCYQFLLHYPNSPMNLCLTGGKLDIDTRVLRQISFTDNQTNPNSLFYIGGRKYACQKIEVTIDENGVQPLKKGFFYEIE